MSKHRLTQMQKKLKPEPKENHSISTPKVENEHLEANPERGNRAAFLKVTITMPPDMLYALKIFGMKRRGEGKKDTDTSSLIREAVAKLLSKDT